MRFTAIVIPSGNATGIQVPAEVTQALGPDARPPVAVTINGHTWRSRIARMRGQVLVGISAANRVACGIAQGDVVEVDVELDTAPRDVDVPTDLAAALDASLPARAAFDRLPFGLKRKHVAHVGEAKSEAVRLRRIARLVETLAAAA